MSCANRGLNAMSYRFYKTDNEGGSSCTGDADLSRRRHARSQRAYTRMLTDRSCINVRFTPESGRQKLARITFLFKARRALEERRQKSHRRQWRPAVRVASFYIHCFQARRSSRAAPHNAKTHRTPIAK